MPSYNSALKGYVADVPKVVFRRCDGKAYAFTELSSATVAANIETIDINGGWSLFPVAVLPGSSTFTMSFTSAQFDADMFAMANKADYVNVDEDPADPQRTYEVDTTERHTPDANHQIELLQTPYEGSVYIAGLIPLTTQSGTVTKGHYLINGKKITFASDDDFDFIDVIYKYSQSGVYEAIITNKESAIGEASAIWPVYGNGDDCTDSDIIGYYIVKVFRARITAIPGMDTSYKSASTFQFELSALDAKRNDGGAYSTAYYRT